MLIQQLPAVFPRSDYKLAILTGLSDPACCHLSPAQERFLRAIAMPEEWKVYRNFPWIDESAPHAEVSLVRASLANGWHYLRARTADHREKAQRHLTQLCSSATRGVILITGSCGAEILRRSLEASLASRIRHVFALGPVAPRPPGVPCTVIQGERDWISRPFLSDPDRIIPGAGHLDYWDHPLVREEIEATLLTLLRECAAPS